MRTDGQFSLGAPCACWLLFQTISTFLIILISHFHTRLPPFSEPHRICLDCFLWTVKTPWPQSGQDGKKKFHGKLSGGSDICSISTAKKNIMLRQNNSKGNSFFLSGTSVPLCAKRRLAPQVFIQTLLGAAAYEISGGMHFLK